MKAANHKQLLAAWVGIGCMVGLLAAPAARAQEITNEQVTAAAQKAVAAIKQDLTPGNFAKQDFSSQGTFALNTLALLNAGLTENDPVVAKAVTAVAELSNDYTYVIALKIQVLAAADAKKYFKEIDAAAQVLISTQSTSPAGMWSYGGGRGRMAGGDHSNTQFALLGLHEAAKAGVKVPAEVWQRSEKHFIDGQAADGGWGYQSAPARLPAGTRFAYGSMTCAGLSSLYICGQRMLVGGKKFDEGKGVYPDCGKYKVNVSVAKGTEWMSKNFSVKENPGRPGAAWVIYYLYAMERVGMLSGSQSFGKHDWYREGAAQLVATQQPGGTWPGKASDTAMALLFLAKGNRPLLIQKVSWRGADTKEGHWNRNIHDLENLTAFIGDKLGKSTTWQTTSLAVPLTDLRISPILLITGHEFPSFTDAERKKLKAYIDAGGTLVFEACCSSAAFKEGFAKYAQEEFRDYGKPAKLSATHEVFGSLYDMKGDTYDLEGINVGCRTSIFFSPRPLSCLWELQTIPVWSDRAFKLGANIAAYATGREQLANKLDIVDIPEAARPAASQPSEIPRGAVRIARLEHSGDYNADPHCLVNLAAQLRDKAKVDVVAKERHLKADEEIVVNGEKQPAIYGYPVVFITGHNEFTMPEKEVAALREYLNRGGFLVADACCGQKAFDASFRKLVAQLYPDEKLETLADDHPIYTGKLGLPLGELKYRAFLAEELSKGKAEKVRGTTTPILEAVTLKESKRTVILYSKYDFTCGLEGDNPFSCRGYVEADAQRLALNIFLYAINY